ncbi:MAG: glycosyltransferase family 2 protein [Candidatus Babeliales bacterium]
MIKYFIFFTFIFSTAIFCFEEKPIVVVIPSYNNKDWYKRNLSSLLSQNYTNFCVIYINDCSSDDTGSLVQEFLAAHDKNKRVQLIKNKARRGALANHWMAIQLIPDNAIVVHLDGDDWFAHENVLKRINQEYQDPNVWMTYGQYIVHPSKQPGHCRSLQPNIGAENKWRDSLLLHYSHLRTFYAWLFKRIKLDDLLIKNNFFPVACDNAFMLPMLEMAGSHVRFIPDILYVYNQETSLNDYKNHLNVQLNIAQYIHKKPRYMPLNNDLYKSKKYDPTVDMLIFSFDRPMQLYALLESIEHYIKNIQTINVLYRASNRDFEYAYENLKKCFPCICFVQQSEKNPHADFKEKTLDLVFARSDNYILFAVDDIIVKDYIDLKQCIDILERMHAYGFFLRLGSNITHSYLSDLSKNNDNKVPPYLEIEPNILAWQFRYAKHDWAYPNTLDMTLYRKRDIESVLRQLSYTTPNTLEGQWYGSTDFLNIGVCFKQSKVVNIPLNIVQEAKYNRIANKHVIYKSTLDLLQKFNNGLKIDINPLYKFANNSAHIDYEPSFILRY